MADLSNLFSSLILPQQSEGQNELDPRIAALLAEKNRIASAAEEAKSQKNSVLEKMGVTPEMQYQQMLEADKPKGFWRNLGKYATEGLTGAVKGRSYVPYSERLRGQAENNYKLEVPLLKEQLDSATRQESKMTEDQRRLAEAAANMGIKVDDLGVKQKNADTRRLSVDQNGMLIPGKINEMNARAGKSGADANLAEMRAAMVEQQRQDLIKRGAMTGDDANNNVMSQLNPDRLASILGVRKSKKDQDAAAKLAGTRPKAAGGSGSSFSLVGGFQDPITGVPMKFDKKTGTVTPALLGGGNGIQKVPTGAQKDAMGRAISGYAQIEQMTPILDRIIAKGKIGGLKGAYEKWLAGQGFGDDPDMRELFNQAKSVANFNSGIHGQRAHEAMKDAFNTIFALGTSPEAVKQGLRASKRAFADRAKLAGALPKDWQTVKVDPSSVDAFLEEGVNKDTLNKLHGTASKSESSASEPTLEQIRAEVARRRAAKGSK